MKSLEDGSDESDSLDWSSKGEGSLPLPASGGKKQVIVKAWLRRCLVLWRTTDKTNEMKPLQVVCNNMRLPTRGGLTDGTYKSTEYIVRLLLCFVCTSSASFGLVRPSAAYASGGNLFGPAVAVWFSFLGFTTYFSTTGTNRLRSRCFFSLLLQFSDLICIPPSPLLALTTSSRLSPKFPDNAPWTPPCPVEKQL